MSAPESSWFNASYNNDTGGSCIKIAPLLDQVGFRDSKNKKGPAVVVPQAAWSAFLGPATESNITV
ncbi:DUF397 domain-containing protein [Streptomyces sp. NBC_01460]|uniref:DUF397 domain-containing protein n=1 Tax=Streptomyces sp. NBC_01460 TaxID=2903875 RepID=UPI002E34100A|nr:DUF397 domain-containing protein [Streptomyces sp. NBC_01460]